MSGRAEQSRAFLEAIRDSPEDDAPRLVYADWLDDHGDTARAEFIRVQCELARMPNDEERRAGLESRERELLSANRATWLGPLDEVLQSGHCTFRRGFPGGAEIRRIPCPVGTGTGRVHVAARCGPRESTSPRSS